MDRITQCRCCNSQSASKSLKASYVRLGNTEIYADIIKECFEIHLATSTTDDGICDICISRLCDAWDFKQQIQKCQKEFQVALVNNVKEAKPLVKQEWDFDFEDDDDQLLFDLKKDAEKIKQEASASADVADMFDLKEITVKKTRKPAKGKKKLPDRKTIKIITAPRRITLSTNEKPMRQIIFTTTSKFHSEHKKHQQNISNILKYSNCTPFANKTLSGYVCAYCKDSFQDPQDLRIHTHTVHKNDELSDNLWKDKSNISVKMDILDLTCTICNTKLENVANLKKHLVNQHQIKFHQNIKDYVLEFKLTMSEILNCALCNSTYETFKMLLQHMNGHYRNHICDICDLGFINKHRLNSHRRIHDTGSFKCSFCEKVFSTKIRLSFHEKYSHKTNIRYFTNCPHCDEKFTNYYQRNRHMVTEHNTSAASYKCNVCDKSFIMKSKLTAHIKKDHLMERNHICSICGQGFFSRQALEEHEIRHNGERIHKCHVCQKAYARKKTLREHLRIHNNDRRFKCGVCGLAFVQKCSMKSHMLSNHGITLSEFEMTRLDSKSP